MKTIVLVSVAAAAVLFAASPAQDLPKLSEFLTSCYRDSILCRNKVRDYVAAADSQHIICRPPDVSINEATSEILDWLRSDSTHPAALNDAPFDDGLLEAATKLYPCHDATPPAEPAAQPATPAEPAAPSAPAQPAP